MSSQTSGVGSAQPLDYAVASDVGVEIAPDVRVHLPLPLKILGWVQDVIVALSLAAMVILPILDLLHVRISGSVEWVQHGTLVVGLIGAAVAARQNRLLSLATTTMLPKGWPRTAAHIFGAAVGAAVAGLLCIAGVQFVQEIGPTSGVIAYGFPKAALQWLIPIGFGLIVISMLYHSAARWRLRWIAPLIAAGIIAAAVWLPVDPPRLIIPAFVVLGIATLLGAPIFAILGGSALILFWCNEGQIASIPVDHYSLVTNASLPMIPLFTLAGYFLAEGGASQRLVNVFSELFGSIRGGPAIVTALLCAFFTSFTGASGVTILALGGVLMPVLVAANYSRRAALGLLTGAGSLGMLFPPCTPMVLYAIIAKVEIKQIFLGSFVPGLVLVIMTAILGVWMGPRKSATGSPTRERFDFRRAARAIWAAKWELLIPVVAIGALFRVSPVTAASITALYAFLTQTVFHRDLNLRKNLHVLVECGLVIGGVLLILGLAQAFTNYLIFAQIPDQAITWMTGAVKSPGLFLLLLNFFLLIVGGLMDVYPAIIVVAPLLVPIGLQYGIDPVHLGVIFLANLEMGFLMPPLGMNLLLASYRFKRPMPEVYRAILPMLVVQFIGVLLITYCPPLTMLLPKWFGQ